MREAVIVSTARTGLAKSWKGALNMTHGATMGGHVVKAAIARAGIEAAEVEDVLMGCANPEGATGANIARQIALAAGCPVTVSGATINRFCSSGLQSIAMAAQRVIAGEADIYVAGGVESISCVQNEMNQHMLADDNLMAIKPEVYWPMLQTAETVAKRYNIGRQVMDEYGVESQRRACAAAAAGKFTDEIAPILVRQAMADKATGMMITKEVTLSDDEGRRTDTTYEDMDSLRWVWQQVRTPAARYAEALTYVQQGNYAAASTVVTNIPVEHELRNEEVFERQRMLDVIAFCQQIAGSGRTMADLTTVEVDALEVLVDGAHDRPAVWAQNILCFAYSRCAAPHTGGELGPRMMQSAGSATPEQAVNTLSVYPNPGSAWVAMDYHLANSREAWLCITDVTGREVERQRLGAERGQFVWDARSAQPGVYAVELMSNGQVVESEKLIVQP